MERGSVPLGDNSSISILNKNAYKDPVRMKCGHENLCGLDLTDSGDGQEPAHELMFVMNFVCFLIYELMFMAGQPSQHFHEF